MSNEVNDTNANASAANANDARAIQRIEAELAKLDAQLAAPAGWQARVLAEVATTEERPGRRPWWWLALPAVGAVAAAAVALVLLRGSADQSPEIAMVVEPDGTIMRSPQEPLPTGWTSSVPAGKTVTFAAGGDGTHHALWIYYKERRLILACPGGPGCSSMDTSVTATIKLNRLGSYQIVAWSSDAPIPIPTDDYDASVATAHEAGAKQDPKPKSLSVH